MPKPKPVSGLSRRRARIGKLVLNRRGRILNANLASLNIHDNHSDNAIKELTIAQADPSVLVTENSANFSMLDNGSFMILKADKNANSRPQSSPDNKMSASKKLHDKAIFSQFLQKDKHVSSHNSRIEKPNYPDLSSSQRLAGSDDDGVMKSSSQINVFPLHMRINQGKAHTAANRSYADEYISADIGDVENNKQLDEQEFQTELAAKEANNIIHAKSTDAGDTSANREKIIDQGSAFLDASPSDSAQSADQHLTNDDKIRRQNWEIGTKVGAAMETLVAEAVGQQVRRLTRNVIREMLEDGILQLPANTIADEKDNTK